MKIYHFDEQTDERIEKFGYHYCPNKPSPKFVYCNISERIK